MPYKDPKIRAAYHKKYIRKWRSSNRNKWNTYVRTWNKKNGRSKYMMQYRKRPGEYLKFMARIRVQEAVKRGNLKKKPCRVCGNKKSEAHHDDYSKPLKVKWFCKQHHSEYHLKIKRKKQ